MFSRRTGSGRIFVESLKTPGVAEVRTGFVKEKLRGGPDDPALPGDAGQLMFMLFFVSREHRLDMRQRRMTEGRQIHMHEQE